MPASAADIRNPGVVYRPLVDLAGNGAIEMILVWRRKGVSPLVQEFLAVACEVLEQRTPTATGAEDR